MKWRNAAAIKLSQYLEATGRELLVTLHEKRPKLIMDGEITMETTALRGAFKEGYERAIEDILKMATEREGAETNADNGSFSNMGV